MPGVEGGCGERWKKSGMSVSNDPVDALLPGMMMVGRGLLVVGERVKREREVHRREKALRWVLCIWTGTRRIVSMM
jgi:hypothetical protein